MTKVAILFSVLLLMGSVAHAQIAVWLTDHGSTLSGDSPSLRFTSGGDTYAETNLWTLSANNSTLTPFPLSNAPTIGKVFHVIIKQPSTGGPFSCASAGCFSSGTSGVKIVYPNGACAALPLMPTSPSSKIELALLYSDVGEIDVVSCYTVGS